MVIFSKIFEVERQASQKDKTNEWTACSILSLEKCNFQRASWNTEYLNILMLCLETDAKTKDSSGILEKNNLMPEDKKDCLLIKKLVRRP